MIISRILFFVVICLYCAAAIGAEHYKEEKLTLVYKGVPLIIYARYTLDDQKRNCSVKNIFDHKNDTIWCTRILDITYDDKPSLEIHFGKEVYLDEIAIVSGCRNSIHGAVAFLGIEKTITDERIFDFTEHYKLSYTPSKQSLNLLSKINNRSIYHLFPIKKLRLEIYETHTKKPEVCISEIEMNLQHTLNYHPEYSWETVKKYIEANADWWMNMKGWDFKIRDKKQHRFLNNSYFTALTYYTMHGNKEAASLFFKYAPLGAIDAEVITDFYKPLMKKWLKQKGISYEE